MTIVQCITVIIFEKQRKNQLVVGRKNERDTLLTLVDGAREPVPLETWRVLFYFLNYLSLSTLLPDTAMRNESKIASRRDSKIAKCLFFSILAPVGDRRYYFRNRIKRRMVFLQSLKMDIISCIKFFRFHPISMLVPFNSVMAEEGDF